jgi:hypothetical protein
MFTSTSVPLLVSEIQGMSKVERKSKAKITRSGGLGLISDFIFVFALWKVIFGVGKSVWQMSLDILRKDYFACLNPMES